MIWALLAVLLFSSSGTADYAALFQPAKTFIQTDIQDKARKKELLAVVAEAEKATDAQMKLRVEVVKELAKLSAQHTTSREELQQAFSRHQTGTEAYQEQMLRHRFELKTKMTREEWAKAFAAEAGAPAQK